MYTNRADLEARELAYLAPYALRSGASAGRMYEEAPSEYRTAFQRDRDRVLHSAAFRRLEYKTQVFANDEGDYYRTRLTHTLEVAQIGRTIARALGANEDLVESVCLAHDLGHPPFGHAGEDALNRCMEGNGGFNHNLQSYRVVTELEKRYPDWPGLNLTKETLLGLAKHGTSFDLSAAVGADPTLRGSLEAQIADATDELAYNAHDLDDGLNAGVLHVEQLNQLDIWRLLCERLGKQPERLDTVTRHTFIRELVGVLVDDLLNETSKQLEQLAPATPLAIQRHTTDVVCYSNSVGLMNRALKTFLYANMYGHYRVVRMQQRAERFIEQMFSAFRDEPRQLPDECRVEVPNKGLHRVIADYIASMTDRSALAEYRRLFDPIVRA